MTYFDSLDFVYQLVLSRFDLTVWIWAIIAFCASLFALNLGWGLLWNSQWTLFKHPGTVIATLIIALFVFASTLSWLGADRSARWLDDQRAELTSQFTRDGARNLRILRAARDRIGSQEGTANNTLTLRSERDAMALASVAAADVRRPLTPSGPLGPGAPFQVRDPAEVAAEVIHSLPAVSYPITVKPQNEWTETALAAQVQAAVSYVTKQLVPGIDELKYALAWAIGLLALSQLVIVRFAAISDIRIQPSITRSL
ncbi:hypothetical protein [uncultured Thiodictyon sp.]|uniref:hypothetical protein n=1 Tax=uncultured Thiodictyon sp. TaxID=1846217 RepID=UPI0025CBB6D9|nr:hypothetical protein [uncultured Thiodictyon sp.]